MKIKKYFTEKEAEDIGEKLEINGKNGDVIDIGMLYTTIMELD